MGILRGIVTGIADGLDRVAKQSIGEQAFNRGLNGQHRPIHSSPEVQAFADQHFEDGRAQQALRIDAVTKVASASIMSDGIRQGSARYIGSADED